jgi:hypothetical protein
MTCRQVRALFSEVYDGEAGPAAAGFAEHLGRCPECRQAWAAYQADLAAVGPALKAAAGAVDFWPRQEAFVARPAAPAGHRVNWWAWGAAAAALAGVSVLVLSLGGTPGHLAGQNPGPEEPQLAKEGTPSRPELAGFLEDDASPVVAPTSLEPGYQLVSREMLGPGTCPENVMLSYRGAQQHVVLEQHGGRAPEPCAGFRIQLDDCVGCMEWVGAEEGIQLSWARDGRFYRLRGGSLHPDHALQLANDFDRRLGTTPASWSPQTQY